MSDVKQLVLKVLGEPSVCALATVTPEGYPWVRYVVAAADQEMNLWFATGASTRKVAQMKNNPNVHLTGGATTLDETKAWVQVEATAEVKTDPETKQGFWQDELAKYFQGPDDPEYVVVKLTPSRIEYSAMDMEDMTPQVWQARVGQGPL